MPVVSFDLASAPVCATGVEVLDGLCCGPVAVRRSSAASLDDSPGAVAMPPAGALPPPNVDEAADDVELDRFRPAAPLGCVLANIVLKQDCFNEAIDSDAFERKTFVNISDQNFLVIQQHVISGIYVVQGCVRATALIREV